MSPKLQRGFSLIEVITVMVILVLLAMWAIPSFVALRDKSYLRGAAEGLLGHLSEARLEAIRSNQNVSVSFDALLADIEKEATVETPTYGDIELDSKLAMLVDPTQEGSVDLTKGAYSIRFGVTPVGQGFICDPNSSNVGYPACP